MPAQSKSQQNFMKLVAYFKKHHEMPEGAGQATEKIKEAASSMTMQQIREFMHKRRKR